jgi:peptidoglycan/LPS O-acetylase OafA/YrhL
MTNLAPLPVRDALEYGNYGVMFFFVLSGFVLTWSASEAVSPRTFWVRRFARIYPSHFVALLLAIPVFYSFAPDPTQSWVKPVDIGILLLSFVLIQGWWRDPVVLFSGNPAAWTLTCEAFFYALHPALNRGLRFLRLRGTLVAALVIIALAFGYRGLSLLWPETFDAVPLPLARLSEFALGMCAAHAMRLGWRPRIKPVVAYVLGAGLLLWLLVSARLGSSGPIEGFLRVTANEWLIVLCVVLVFTVAARDVAGGRSILRWRPLVRLGDWSYAFYLVHATAIYAVKSVVGVQLNGWWNLVWYAAMLVVSIALAAALHYLVEKPCERFIRSRWGQAAPRAGVAEPVTGS